MAEFSNFTAAEVAVADHEQGDGWALRVLDGEWPEPTLAERRFRIRQLRLAARLLRDGHTVEHGWAAAQLADWADVLEAGLEVAK